MSVIEQIKQHIANGNTEEALKALSIYAQSKGKEFKTQAILLSAQFQTWKKNMLIGLKQENDERRRIELAILELLDSPSSDSPKHPEDGKVHKSQIFRPAWMLPAALVAALVLVALWLFLPARQPTFTITYPNTKEIALSLIDECSYRVEVRGTGKLPANGKQIYGKYWHGEEWWPDVNENPIAIKADGSWSAAFFHGCHGEDGTEKPQSREHFRFGLFEYEAGQPIEDLWPPIAEIEFDVLLVEE